MHVVVQAFQSRFCGVSSSPCTCGRRRGGTRTAARSATCSWPTTCGTRPRSGRGCRSSQLRPRGAVDPGGAGAAGRLRRPSPGAGQGEGHRGGSPGVRGIPPAGRHARAGRAVGAAGHRPGDAGTAEGPPPGRGGGAGAVRPGREPGARAVLEAGRGPLGQRGRADRGPAADHRRCLLPGDGLAAADPGALEKQVFDRASEVSRPRGRSAVLRHHLHVLRDGGGRRPGRPRPAGQARPGRHRGRRGPGRRGSGPGASPRTTATTCPRSSSGWPSPATGSRCACGAGPGTPATPR